jgi:hypothetical protein
MTLDRYLHIHLGSLLDSNDSGIVAYPKKDCYTGMTQTYIICLRFYGRPGYTNRHSVSVPQADFFTRSELWDNIAEEFRLVLLFSPS